MVRVTAVQLKDKWQRNMQNAQIDIRQGVERTTVNPMELAANAADKWAQNTVNARDKFERRLRGTPASAWKDGMLGKGLSRLNAGVDAAGPKMLEFSTQLIEHENRGLAIIDSMPKNSLGDSKARMIFWVDHMNTFVRS